MPENTREWDCEHVSASEAGDYFQVMFAKAPASDEEYLLIQRQFESPDNGKCYVETDDPAFCGHYRIVAAQLSRNRFLISLADAPLKNVVVSFNATESDYAEAKRVLLIMAPELEVQE
jgi:hypothetical protein